MTEIQHHSDRASIFVPHYAVVALGIAGVIVVQLAWPEILRREPAASWWPIDVLVLLASSGYFLSAAGIHWRCARSKPSADVPLPRLVARTIFADLTIAMYVSIVLIRGPQASLFRSGLWILLPTLLIVALASVSVSLLAFRNGWRRLRTDTLPVDPSSEKATGQLHTAISIAVLLSFFLLEYVEPERKPWEAKAREVTPSAGSKLLAESACQPV